MPVFCWGKIHPSLFSNQRTWFILFDIQIILDDPVIKVSIVLDKGLYIEIGNVTSNDNTLVTGMIKDKKKTIFIGI